MLRMIRLPHRWLGMGAAALLTLAGCEEDNKFSYFKVSVNVNPSANAEFLARIAACGVNVVDTSGNVLDFASISCAEGQVRNHALGVVDWSTAEPRTVRFIVTLKDRATREIAKGTSADLSVGANATVTGSLQVDPLPDPVMPTADGGTPAADAATAGGDAASDSR